MPIFPFVSLMKRHNICYVKTICLSIYACFIYDILIILILIHLIVTIFVYFKQGKVYVYAFHLKQGGVIQPHS